MRRAARARKEKKDEEEENEACSLQTLPRSLTPHPHPQKIDMISSLERKIKINKACK